MEQIIVGANQDIRQVSSVFFNINFYAWEVFLTKSDEACVSFNIVFAQVLHNLQMWSSTKSSLTYDEAKEEASKSQKNIKIVSLLFTIYISCKASDLSAWFLRHKCWRL